MAYKQMLLALGLIAATPVSADVVTQLPPGPSPTDSADTRYCLRIEAIIGSRIEEVRCWTRQEWAEKEVDVDADWDKEGVAVLR